MTVLLEAERGTPRARGSSPRRGGWSARRAGGCRARRTRACASRTRTFSSSSSSFMRSAVLRSSTMPKAESQQARLRVDSAFQPFEVGELGLELGRADAVLVAEVGLRVDRVLLLRDAVETLVPHENRRQRVVLAVLEVILLEHADPHVFADRDVAGARLDFAREDLQQRRLPGTVRSDQAVAVAARELERDIFEEDAFAELKREVGGRDHGEAPCGARTQAGRWNRTSTEMSAGISSARTDARTCMIGQSALRSKGEAEVRPVSTAK